MRTAQLAALASSTDPRIVLGLAVFLTALLLPLPALSQNGGCFSIVTAEQHTTNPCGAVPSTRSVLRLPPLLISNFVVGTLVLGPDTALRVSGGQSAARASDTTLTMRADDRMEGPALARIGLLDPNALGPSASQSYFVESAPTEPSPVVQGSGFSGFVTANHDRGDRAETGVAGDYGQTFSTTGMLAGVDYLRRDHWLAGVALGYSSSDVIRNNFNDGVKSDILNLAGYASLRPLPNLVPGARLTGSFGYGWMDMDERRHVTDGTTRNAQLDSRTLSARLLGSYELGGARWSLRPEAGLQYFSSEVDAADLGNSLRSDAHGASVFYGSLGLVAQGRFEFAGLRVSPQARFRWMASIDESYDAVVLRTDTDSFRSSEMRAEGDYFVVGGGLLLDLGRSFDANVSVDQIVGSRLVSATTLAAGMTYRF